MVISTSLVSVCVEFLGKRYKIADLVQGSLGVPFFLPHPLLPEYEMLHIIGPQINGIVNITTTKDDFNDAWGRRYNQL